MAAKAGTEKKTQAEQVAELESLMEDSDVGELRSVHVGGTKASKWRTVIENFVDSGQEVRKFVVPDDGPYKFGAITSGLGNALGKAREAGAPYPVKVTSNKAKKIVLMYNTELVADEEAEAATS